MTLVEAQQIEQALDAGLLDLSLPGTAAVVNEAHRLTVRAQLWGVEVAEKRPPYRLGTRIAFSGAAILVAAICGMCLEFLTAR